MIPPKRTTQTDSSVDSWLMSYADLITLLMCFFIIFVSVSEPKRDKFTQVTHGLANRFGAVDIATPLQGSYLDLVKFVESNQLIRDIMVEKTDYGIRLDIASGVFFVPGSAELDGAKLETLNTIINTIKQLDFLEYSVRIEAHTSNAPVPSEFYGSNWEFSAVRAAKIARYFEDNGIEGKRLETIGYGAARPKLPNEDAQGNPIEQNQRHNERIGILVERDR